MTSRDAEKHPFADIDTPALLVDLDRLERNLQTMARFAADARIALRPHVKTHKCPTIARMQMDLGAIGLTCAKLAEAQVMADAGLDGLLIACPVVGDRKIARLVELAQRADVLVAADDRQNVGALSAAATAANLRLNILVEVDVGLHRCGVAPGRPALELARAIEALPGLRFAGLLGYEGHCVAEKDAARRQALATAAIATLCQTRQLIVSEGIAVTVTSGGGTGTYRFTGATPGISEIQPGSYALMDSDYQRVTPEFHVALTVLATVVSRQGDRVVLDAGYKSVAIDHAKPQALDVPQLVVEQVTEEMTRCRLAAGARELNVGDRVRLVSGHCCGTTNLHDAMYAVRGSRIEAVWPISARGRSS